MGFNGPKVNQPAPPPLISDIDPQVAMQDEKRKQLALEQQNRNKGRATTILTGGQGLVDSPGLASRTLMGF